MLNKMATGRLVVFLFRGKRQCRATLYTRISTPFSNNHVLLKSAYGLPLMLHIQNISEVSTRDEGRLHFHSKPPPAFFSSSPFQLAFHWYPHSMGDEIGLVLLK